MQCSIMYVQCNKAKIRFSRRQASFRERAQLSLLQRLQWLTADDENRLALTAQPRNRLGLIVKIDADLKRTVVEYQRVRLRHAVLAPPFALLYGRNERGQPARGDRFAIDTLHDALSTQRDGDGFPTMLLLSQVADQRKNWFNDGSRAGTAMCVTVCRQSRVGPGAILRQTFCIDRHFRDIGIQFQQCQQGQFRAGTSHVQ